MKIGYLLEQGIDTRKRPFSGPANHVRHVVEQLEARGHQIRLLNRLNGQIWKSENLEEYKPIFVRGVDGGPRRWLEKGVRRAQATLKLPYLAYFEGNRFARACLQELVGFDLLYQRKSWMGFGGGLATQWLNVPLILEENGDHLDDLRARGESPAGIQLHLSLALMKKAMWRASHVIASGEGWRRNFIRRWDYDPNCITTVENGTELGGLLAREQLTSFCADRPSGETVTLIYVGGFYAWHGIPVLLLALERARKQGIQARLILIGSGDGMEEARQQAQSLNLNEAVTFTGRLKPEAYAPMLADADIGLSPYCGWKEYSGLKILDYKAAGLPTIASGLDGMPPTLKNEKTGLIIPPCDEEALCQAIVRLSADVDMRRRLGRQARLEAEQEHGWNHTATQIEQIFYKVLAEKGNL